MLRDVREYKFGNEGDMIEELIKRAEEIGILPKTKLESIEEKEMPIKSEDKLGMKPSTAILITPKHENIIHELEKWENGQPDENGRYKAYFQHINSGLFYYTFKTTDVEKNEVDIKYNPYTVA